MCIHSQIEKLLQPTESIPDTCIAKLPDLPTPLRAGGALEADVLRGK